MSSAIFVSVAVYAIFFAPNWFFFLVVEAFIFFALNEFLTLVEKKGIVINRGLGLFFGALLPFSYYFPAEPIILMMACLSFFIFNFHRRLREQALVSTATTFFGIVYVAWFFAHLTKIKYLDHGALWVFYVILLVKGGDAGAYFIGKTFGKIKLIEHISPNKSVEGAVGGFATTVILSIISKSYLGHVEMIHLIVLGVSLGVLAQFGDLAESLLKRDVGIKDSGHVPGLGGILDMLDSLLLTIPFLYYYLTVFPGANG